MGRGGMSGEEIRGDAGRGDGAGWSYTHGVVISGRVRGTMGLIRSLEVGLAATGGPAEGPWVRRQCTVPWLFFKFKCQSTPDASERTPPLTLSPTVTPGGVSGAAG